MAPALPDHSKTESSNWETVCRWWGRGSMKWMLMEVVGSNNRLASSQLRYGAGVWKEFMRFVYHPPNYWLLFALSLTQLCKKVENKSDLRYAFSYWWQCKWNNMSQRARLGYLRWSDLTNYSKLKLVLLVRKCTAQWWTCNNRTNQSGNERSFAQ